MILQVTVKPNARQRRLEPLPDGTWRACVMSPPHEGRANAELITLLAEHFHCPKSAITIQHGATGRHKRIHLDVPGDMPEPVRGKADSG